MDRQGADVTIREARPDDAAQLVPYVHRLSEEPDANIALMPGEFELTVDEEAQLLADSMRSENSLFLVAEAGGRIVGELSCLPLKRRALRHRVTLGLSVEPAWRRRGVGSRLLAHGIEWAKASGVVTRMELAVFERNVAAIEFDRKAGFVVEGRRRHAAFRDGEYLDDVIMALVW